jgi:excisionase family DNA binding protein
VLASFVNTSLPNRSKSFGIKPNMTVKSTEDNDEILTTRQVAKLLKIHRVTVYKLAEKGMIPAWRVGKSWRFLKSEVIKHFVETGSLEKAKPKQKAAPAQSKRKPASSDS